MKNIFFTFIIIFSLSVYGDDLKTGKSISYEFSTEKPGFCSVYHEFLSNSLAGLGVPVKSSKCEGALLKVETHEFSVSDLRSDNVFVWPESSSGRHWTSRFLTIGTNIVKNILNISQINVEFYYYPGCDNRGWIKRYRGGILRCPLYIGIIE